HPSDGPERGVPVGHADNQCHWQPVHGPRRGVARAARDGRRALASPDRRRPARRLHHLLDLQPRADAADRAWTAGARRALRRGIGGSGDGGAVARPRRDAGIGMSQEVRQFTVQPDDDGVRLDRWFKRHLPQVGFATVSRWARTGQIRVDGKRVKPEDRLSAGQIVRVPPGGESDRPKPQKRELTPEQIEQAESMLIRKTGAALVLNKPPGLATQGGTGTFNHVDGLLDAYAAEGEPRPRLVHRLDKDTSGVLLVARTPGSAAFFSKRFSGRSAKKVYWALVVGVPEVADGTIDAPLAKQPGTGGEKMHVDDENGQPARTRYRVLDRAGNRAAWVELQPLTGRTHQLRVHMAAIGHPIV